ncbi:hypothetical protein D9M73_126640 [compost metagenome]
MQVDEVFRFFSQYARCLQALFQRGPQRRDFADRVRCIEDAFDGGAVLEEQQPVAVGRVSEGQRQLHLPVGGAAGRQPANGFAITVGTDFQPFGIVRLRTFVHIEAAEDRLCFTFGTARRRADFAARCGQHALEQGLFTGLDQRFVIGLGQWADAQREQGGTAQQESTHG